MTQIDFNALPWLLSRRQVLEVTGLSPRELSALVVSRPGLRYQRTARGYGKYFKSEVAAVMKLKL